jgi:hypothetical protein
VTDRAEHTQPDASSPAPWAPPGAAPFGVPASPPPSPHPTAGHAPNPGYAPPVGYAPPAGYTPTTRYAPAAASGFPTIAAPAARRSPALGLVALILGLVAAAGASVAGATAAFNIGLGTGREVSVRALGAGFDWSILTPVREWVLLGEVAFWAGTIIGITALVLGIVAIVTRRGRGAGIAAVVIAAAGPVVFGTLVQTFLTAGFASGSGVAG